MTTETEMCDKMRETLDVLSAKHLGYIRKRMRRNNYEFFSYETALIIFGVVPLWCGLFADNLYMIFFGFGVMGSSFYQSISNIVLELVDKKIHEKD